MIHSKSPLARDRLHQRANRIFAKVFNGAAGGADQVVVMAGLAPDVGGDVPGTLEALRQPGGDEAVERAKHRRPANVGMALADSLVQLLG